MAGAVLVFIATCLAGAPARLAAVDSTAAAARPIDVDRTKLSPVVNNPYTPFASIERAVYEGKELDAESGETVSLRIVSTVRAAPETRAGVRVTVVEVTEYEDGELVEKTEDYYAQDASGIVYYIGERVDDYEDGKISGHGGQWLMGEGGALPGLYMPADPKVGAVFEQERAPGIAEDRSTVVAVGVEVAVPAGTFADCIETEDYDPIGKTKQRKTYCRGVGLVQEVFGAGRSLQLVQLDRRADGGAARGGQ